MNRSDLVQQLANRSGLPPADADWFVRCFFEALSNGIVRDGRVELRGFGVFQVNTRMQAGFLNPKNGIYYGSIPVKTIKFYSSNQVAKVTL